MLLGAAAAWVVDGRSMLSGASKEGATGAGDAAEFAAMPVTEAAGWMIVG